MSKTPDPVGQRTPRHASASSPRTPPPYILIARNLLWDHKHRERMGMAIWTYAKLLDLRTHANGQILWGRCLNVRVWARMLKTPFSTIRRDLDILRDGEDPYLTTFGGKGLGLALSVRKSKGWKLDSEAEKRVSEVIHSLEKLEQHPGFAKPTSRGSKTHESGVINPHPGFPIIRRGSEASKKWQYKTNKTDGDVAAQPSEGGSDVAVPIGDEEARDAIAKLRIRAEHHGDRGAGKLAALLEDALESLGTETKMEEA